MSTLLAIDSGYPDCAVAAVEGKRLVAVDTVEWQARRVCGFRSYSRVVVEVPQGDGRAVPVDDLIRVAVAGVRLAERLVQGVDVREYRPREWKGSTPKPPHHNRAWGALDDDERMLLGGDRTHAAIVAACKRGAQNAWRKPGVTYYRARELPSVGGLKITHDILDAVALALYDLRRIPKG